MKENAQAQQNRFAALFVRACAGCGRPPGSDRQGRFFWFFRFTV